MGSLRKKSYMKPLPEHAELFVKKGQQFARWKDGKGKVRTSPVTEAKDGTLRVSVDSGKWLAKYRDGSGVIREVATGCRDRGAAQTMLTDLERRAELVRSGVISVAQESIADHVSTPIVKHFETYRKHRVMQELNETRIKNTDSRLKRLADECGFRRLSDLSGEALTQWLGQQLSVGMGAGTRNEYRAELIGFANWCVRTGRLAVSPFFDVPRANAKADQRRKRRALAEPELEKLLHVARWRPLAEYGRTTIQPETPQDSKRSNWSMAPITYDTLEAAVTLAQERLTENPEFARKLDQRGRERALIYRTLVMTGLRRGELASLSIGSLELDVPTPFAVLAAGDEKNGQGSEIPLRADLVVELRAWIAEKREGFTGSENEFSHLPLFSVPASLLRALNRDLKAAGIAKTDDRGRVVDVHAMRMTLATMLNKAGVAPRTAQEIMRHSDIRLTMSTYTDARLLNVTGALDSLPTFSSTLSCVETGEMMLATGSELKLPPKLPPATFQTVHPESSTVILTGDLGDSTSSLDDCGNRTNPTEKALSEGFSDKALKVGMTGFEPATSASRTQRSTKLSYIP
jgi:integrase